MIFLQHSKNKVTSDMTFKYNHLYFIRFIRLFKNSLYLCTIISNFPFMSTQMMNQQIAEYFKTQPVVKA